MAVDVKKVANRRKVRYQTLDDFVQDAERLSQASVRTLGNRSYDQILGHLAFAMNGSIDGSVLRIAWPVRMVARLLRKRILTGGLSPGFRLSRANDARAWSEESPEIRPALEKARQAVSRLQAEEKRCPHPALGQLSKEEWNTFHLRHAELHMSFVVPS
jgi:hypothetical protein